MDACVYFLSPLPCSLERLEDAVEDVLQHQGEIIGAGQNAHGGNIDVRFKGRTYPRDQALKLLREAFAEFALADRGKIVIDGEEFPLT
jgi:hypothetical protein